MLNVKNLQGLERVNISHGFVEACRDLGLGLFLLTEIFS